MIPSKSTIVFLSTYPPRECGIATFTQDLLTYTQKFLGNSIACKVAALNYSSLDIYKYPPEVAWELDQNDEKALAKFARIVSKDSTIKGIIIQHEYGIFGGEQGEKILSFMKNCKKPMLVTLHTILPSPADTMKKITAEIIHYATTLVVLTNNSKEIIEKLYPESIGKIFVIPHGIHPTTFSDPKKYKAKLEVKNRIVLSTFGLLSPGKGIEYMIKSLPEVIKKYPSVLYLVLGETHPVVRRSQGEKYRLELEELVTQLGLESHVRFYDQYLSLPDLHEFLKATDIYISTSTNPFQAVSGTLSYALGAGRAVISTDFAQAKEIISEETGRLVAIKDEKAFTSAILDLLKDEKRLKKMRLQAYRSTREMLWSNVSERYINLLTRTIIPQLNMNHLHNMTDEFGIFQFATLAIPNKNFGYTLDDNARALIVCSWMIKKEYTKDLKSLIIIFLSFIKKCQQANGSFINYLDFTDKASVVQNSKEDLADAVGRALWALSEIIQNNTLSEKIINEATEIYTKALIYIEKEPLQHLRARAFAIKSFSLAFPVLPNLQKQLLHLTQEYADSLLAALAKNSLKEWVWFESQLSYNNALLAESLLIASVLTKNLEYKKKGLQSLQFLISKTFSNDMYIPIGHSHWYKNNLKRSHYDQQPEDPTAMILALQSAYVISQDITFKNLAHVCFSWFLGNNTLHKSLYDDKTGGCYDGLHPDRVNLNEGAESLLSYMMSRFVIKELS